MAFLTWISGIVGYLAREKGKDWVKLLWFGFILGLIDYVLTVLATAVSGIFTGLSILAGFLAFAILLLIFGAIYEEKDLLNAASCVFTIGLILFTISLFVPAVATTLTAIFATAGSVFEALSNVSIIFIDLAYVLIGGAARELIAAVERIMA